MGKKRRNLKAGPRRKKLRQEFKEDMERFEDTFEERELQDNFVKFLKIVRTFLARSLGLKYQFTFDELKEDVTKKRYSKKTKKLVEKFADELSELQYANMELTMDQFIRLEEDFKDIFTILQGEQEKRSKQGAKVNKLFARLKGLFVRQAEEEEEIETEGLEKYKEETADPGKLVVKPIVDELDVFIEEIRTLLERYKDPELIQKDYQDVMKLYSTATDEKRKSDYGKIKELYEQITSV